MTTKHNLNRKKIKSFNSQARAHTASLLTTLGMASLLTACNRSDLLLNSQVNAQALPSSTSTLPATPTSLPPLPTLSIPSPTPSPTPTATPWPTPTSWPTPTPWPTPASWLPVLPTLTPVPITVNMPAGGAPVSYSPPDGVDVFGSTILRWSYTGALAADEFFDIRIRPAGSNDSAFVAWSKLPQYELQPWSGWQPGLYTWQIGIIKGTLEGDTKHFIADTGRASQPLLIKWQASGGGGGTSGGVSGGGGSSSSGGGGGGSSSGGS